MRTRAVALVRTAVVLFAVSWAVQGCSCRSTFGDPEVCDDGLDNDGDLAVDCSDSDCIGDPSCTGVFEICGNGVDDDFNGFADCADTACAADPSCTAGMEDCINGIDDDGDGFADCADGDCQGHPSCNTDPCLIDPTLPMCSKPPPGAEFGVGGSDTGFIDMPPPPVTDTDGDGVLDSPCDAASPIMVDGATFSGTSPVLTGGSGIYSGMVVGGTLARIQVSVVELAGYYEVPLTSNSFTFTMSFAQTVTLPTVTLRIVPIGLDGTVGQCFLFPIDIIQVGGGDLQISLTWDTPSDLDLYVIEPTGTEIYYGNLTSACGEQDLDANPACATSAVSAENVTYQACAPPNGMYIVKVNNWTDCEGLNDNWILTVNVGGVPTLTMGTESGPGPGGGAGAGTPVYCFDYPSGMQILPCP